MSLISSSYAVYHIWVTLIMKYCSWRMKVDEGFFMVGCIRSPCHLWATSIRISIRPLSAGVWVYPCEFTFFESCTALTIMDIHKSHIESLSDRFIAVCIRKMELHKRIDIVLVVYEIHWNIRDTDDRDFEKASQNTTCTSFHLRFQRRVILVQ